MRTMKTIALLALISLSCASDPLSPVDSGDAPTDESTAEVSMCAALDYPPCQGIGIASACNTGGPLTVIPCGVSGQVDDVARGALDVTLCLGGGHEQGSCVVNVGSRRFSCVARCTP